MKLFKKKQPKEPYLSQEIFNKKYPNYSFGKYTYGVPEVFDWNENSTLKIGNFCSISSNVKIYLGGHHRTDWISTYPFPAFFDSSNHINDYGGTNGDVIIGSDVWIAANVTILSGVTIGHGAVLANSSVITKDVDNYQIVGGNPAKHIKYRFNEEIRNILLSIAWWKWDEEKIIQQQELLCSSNLDKLIEYTQGRK